MSALSSATSTAPGRPRRRRCRPARPAPEPSAGSTAGSQRSASVRNGVAACDTAGASGVGGAEPLLRQVRGAVGQRHRERRADVGGALRRHRAAVQADELLDHRQTDAAALARARAGAGHPGEALEEAGQLRGRDADARVGDGEDGAARARSEPDGDAALERVLEGVGEEVEDDLLPHVPVDVHRLGQRRRSRRRRPARPGRRRSGTRWPARRSWRDEVDRLEPGLDPPGLQAGEVEQGVDQLAQPQRVALDDLELLARPAAVDRSLGGRAAPRPGP